MAFLMSIPPFAPLLAPASSQCRSQRCAFSIHSIQVAEHEKQQNIGMASYQKTSSSSGCSKKIYYFFSRGLWVSKENLATKHRSQNQEDTITFPASLTSSQRSQLTIFRLHFHHHVEKGQLTVQNHASVFSYWYCALRSKDKRSFSSVVRQT